MTMMVDKTTTPALSLTCNINDNSHQNNNNHRNGSLSKTMSSTRRKETRRKEQKRRRRILLYSVIIFVVCWLQISVNIFTYFISHHLQQQNYHQTQQLAARFLLYSSTSSSLGGGNSNIRNLLRGSNTNSFTHNLEQQQLLLQQQQQQQPSILLKAQLSQLETRLRHLQQVEVEQDNTNDSKTKVLFIPFTIRDAQRTVPTQIPHGFHVFDFIDLYASETSGDQNQTAVNTTTNNNSYFSLFTTKAKLYHDGKDVTAPTLPSSTSTSTSTSARTSGTEYTMLECREYSKKCYRAKMLQVIQYLISLQQHNSNSNDYYDEYYYFYMEADNDLCVPLNKIEELALKYRRYFINTGEGIGSASGWIMSEQFLYDFYHYWYNISNSNDNGNSNEVNSNNTNMNKKNNNEEELSLLLTDEEKLEPNKVAKYILKQNKKWSVTRRYLTSHSILVGNMNDASSISDLYEHEHGNQEGNSTTNTNKAGVVVAAAAVTTDENARSNSSSFNLLQKLKSKIILPQPQKPDNNNKSSVMVPARYLPRCLEPHRGIWPDKNKKHYEEKKKNTTTTTNNNNDNIAIDMYHWDFFDYSLCPENDIFPCKEGQLE